MNSHKLRSAFINFFVGKKHKQIPSASLVPQDDPTVLFTTAGMHPLVPYLLGQKHPLGKRLVSVQKCLRTDDIEEVGDNRHFTFFEMLGNWSLGDYFKKEAIEMSFEFLTDKKWLGLSPDKIYVSVFEGDKDAPRDVESIGYWTSTFARKGIKAKPGERIFTYGKDQNWWGPAGQTGPCGPDTEMFYDTGLPHDKKYGTKCHPNCQCGRFVEIWNDVFMEYNKTAKGEFTALAQKNVDTGLGTERMVAILDFIQGKTKIPDPFQTDLFSPLIKIIETKSGQSYQQNLKNFRIIADHMRASVFLAAEGIEPSNKDRGYILRRILRRAVFALSQGNSRIDLEDSVIELGEQIQKLYSPHYPELVEVNFSLIIKEVKKFKEVLENGTKLVERLPRIDGKIAFNLFATYGIPLELTFELAKAKGEKLNRKEFDEQFEKHQQISRKGIAGRFAGGLQDQSKETTKLHTATHLLHQALRQILGTGVQQAGSNITAERLRFDFSHSEKLSPDQISQIENLINQQIKKNLQVESVILTLDEARRQGALAFFGQKYPEQVKVFSIGTFSKEVCGGPHVDFTGTLGTFKIIKEEAVGVGKRRIYAKLV